MQNFSKNIFSLHHNYRYAYNGMEKDDEVSGNGNSYTTQFRQYDPRLGRWKSLDPMAGKYPDQSPFAAFNNNPVYFTDPLGLEGQGAGDGAKTKGKPGEKHKAKKAAKEYAKKHGIDKKDYKVVRSESTGNWWMDYKIESGVGTHKVLEAKTDDNKSSNSNDNLNETRNKISQNIKRNPVAVFPEVDNINTISDDEPMIPVYDQLDERWYEDNSVPNTWSDEKEELFQKWLKQVGSHGGYSVDDLNPTRKMTMRKLREYWEGAEAGGDDLFVESGTTKNDGQKNKI